MGGRCGPPHGFRPELTWSQGFAQRIPNRISRPPVLILHGSVNRAFETNLIAVRIYHDGVLPSGRIEPLLAAVPDQI